MTIGQNSRKSPQKHCRTLISVFSAAIIIYCLGCAPQNNGLTLTTQRQTSYVITLGENSSASEQYAAQELSKYLKKVTGTDFPIVDIKKAGVHPQIAVGPQAVSAIHPNMDLTLEKLTHDGIILKTYDSHLLLTGAHGANRGTLYAVYTFLEDIVGLRWWTKSATYIPHHETLVIGSLNREYRPPFAYRQPFIREAFDSDWCAQNKCNGSLFNTVKLDEKHGGSIQYAGRPAHSFDFLIPPKNYFAMHPEWYSEINGKRIAPPSKSQWCLTNQELLAECIKQVRALLEKSPAESIVSVSQNDWNFRCECSHCRAVEKEEGSPSGPLLRFVNQVADAIRDDFPQARIDTFAYHYTQTPPRKTKPSPNVIVRLCSIEASFSHPLSHSQNKVFSNDISAWASMSNTLYIWDYVTNFQNYVYPFPNLRVLGPNIRFFEKNHVRGVFEQGVYNSPGGEFSELRAWVLAKLLWNPNQDDNALIREFIVGYYGEAAPYILKAINAIHDAVEKNEHYLTIGDPIQPPYLAVDLLRRCHTLYRNAESVIQTSPEMLRRVQLAHAPILHALISLMSTEKQFAEMKGITFSGEDQKTLVREFLNICKQNQIQKLSESDRNDVRISALTRLLSSPDTIVIPKQFSHLKRADWFDAQDSIFKLYHIGVWAEWKADPNASDNSAVVMPSTHIEWATQYQLPEELPNTKPNEKWNVYASIRIDKNKVNSADAFRCGVYDKHNPPFRSEQGIPLNAIDGTDYQLYRLGTCPPGPDRYAWVAPANNPNVKRIWIDRFFLVRESEN